MEWKDYITEKYLLWRSDKIGRKGSAASFAREIGVTPQLLSDWMNRGKIASDEENIKKLTAHFGMEVYDVLGLRRPNADDQYSVLLGFGFPPEFVERLLLAREEYSSELASKGISIDSPAARAIIRTALNKFGIHLIETE